MNLQSQKQVQLNRKEVREDGYVHMAICESVELFYEFNLLQAKINLY